MKLISNNLKLYLVQFNSTYLKVKIRASDKTRMTYAWPQQWYINLRQ